MKKWNLYELFSYLDPARLELPHLKSSCRISGRRVRKRVMEQLAQDTEMPMAYSRGWNSGRVVAIVTAAVLILSGSAITAAAASGGFRQLYDRFFGTGTVYPEMVEELYAVPEPTVTDTCDKIDVQVLGVFGDARTCHVVLELTGTNGYTLPEDLRLLGGGIVDRDTSGSDCVSGGGSIMISHDSSDSGHLYYLQVLNFDEDIKQGQWKYEFSSGAFTNGVALHETSSLTQLKCWLGYTNADLNAHRDITSEELEQIKEHYICLNADGEEIDFPDVELLNEYSEKNQLDYRFLSKELLAAEGSISLEFPMEYPITQTVQDTFTYEETEMQLELTPFQATFTWNMTDPLPSYLKPGVHMDDCLQYFLCSQGYVKLADGTLKKPEQISMEFCSGSVSSAELENVKGTFMVSFAEPVDPAQVTEIYIQQDGREICIWEKS